MIAEVQGQGSSIIDPTFSPLLGALRRNMSMPELRAFLAYAAEECGTTCDECGDQSNSAPGLPCGRVDDDCDDSPCSGTYAPPPVPPVSRPSISADSETPEVAAWCKEQGLKGRVVGDWVWISLNVLPGGKRTPEMDALLSAAGFKFSQGRQEFFHMCTVSGRRQPGDYRRRGGNLERFHGTADVDTYNPKTFDTRPEWARRKAARKGRK